MFPPAGLQCPGEHVMLAEIREREPKGKTWKRGCGFTGARAPNPAPPESLKSRYPSRLEGLVWIRLGFSSDFPQELGLYA